MSEDKYSLGYAICNSIQENKDKIEKLEKQNNRLKIKNKKLKERIDKAKVEISALMSRYFYEEDFYIEDTDLDKVLQILDKGEDNNV